MASKTDDKDKKPQIVSILLMGDSSVGKGEFVKSYIGESYSMRTSTIGVDLRTKLLSINGKDIKMRLWDTAGQERYQNITKAQIKGVNGIVFIYDTNSEDSYSHVKIWLHNLIKVVDSKDLCVFIVGKTDEDDANRRISHQEGTELAEVCGATYYEMSLAEATKINSMFDEIAKKIVDKQGDKLQFQEPLTPSSMA